MRREPRECPQNPWYLFTCTATYRSEKCALEFPTAQHDLYIMWRVPGSVSISISIALQGCQSRFWWSCTATGCARDRWIDQKLYNNTLLRQFSMGAHVVLTMREAILNVSTDLQRLSIWAMSNCSRWIQQPDVQSFIPARSANPVG